MNTYRSEMVVDLSMENQPPKVIWPQKEQHQHHLGGHQVLTSSDLISKPLWLLDARRQGTLTKGPLKSTHQGKDPVKQITFGSGPWAWKSKATNCPTPLRHDILCHTGAIM